MVFPGGTNKHHLDYASGSSQCFFLLLQWSLRLRCRIHVIGNRRKTVIWTLVRICWYFIFLLVKVQRPSQRLWSFLKRKGEKKKNLYSLQKQWTDWSLYFFLLVQINYHYSMSLFNNNVNNFDILWQHVQVIAHVSVLLKHAWCHELHGQSYFLSSQKEKRKYYFIWGFEKWNSLI